MLQYVYDRGDHFRCDAHTFAILQRQGHWDVLAFLLDHDLVEVDDYVVTEMIQSDDIAIGELVTRYAHRFQRTFEHHVGNLLEWGDTERLRALLDRGIFTTDFSTAINFDIAATLGHLELVQFLHERDLAQFTTEAMDGAAVNEHWDVVMFLHHYRIDGCTTRTMDAAAEQGYLEHVQFLHENRSEGCSSVAMDEAAKHRNMDILRFLHEHTHAGCTTDAMGHAAARGYLHVVEFLHTHRSEGCTVNAMNDAAGNGHLEIVRFLHENRSEGCTAAAVKGALCDRHTGVVQYLREQYPQFFGPDILHDALHRGAFDLFLDLQATFPDEANDVVSDVLFDAGQKLELPTIRFIIDVLQRRDVAHRAMEGAAQLQACAKGQWLRAVAAVIGQECAVVTPPDTTAPTELTPLHPFLTDARTPTWAIARALDCDQFWHDPFWRIRGRSPWAVRAVYAHDMAMLAVLRDIPPSARPRHNCHGHEVAEDILADQFGFADARAAAIRSGNLAMLQWLLQEIDLPVEPTLLSEAVYYHKYDIAEWLLINYPQACQETNWASMVYVPDLCSCGLDNGLLDWLEPRESIRACLDFGSIIDVAVRSDDRESLRRLVEWYPELLASRQEVTLLVCS